MQIYKVGKALIVQCNNFYCKENKSEVKRYFCAPHKNIQIDFHFQLDVVRTETGRLAEPERLGV
jgi:hypothetical protein